MNNSKRYILVIGANGSLGSNITNHLTKKKKNVIAFTRKKSDISRIKKPNKSLEIVEFNKSNLKRCFKEKKITHIFNCVVSYDRNNNSNNLKKIIAANIELPILLMELANEYNSVFINFDSYYSKFKQINEKLAYYTNTKKNLKLWLNYFSKKILIFNFIVEHVYGDTKLNNKFIETTIYQLLKNKYDHLDFTTGHQKRDFIHIDDLINKIFKIIEKYKFKKGLYEINIGNGYSISLRYFIERIKKLSNSSTKLNFGAIKMPDYDIHESKANLPKWIKKRKNLKDIDIGIKKTINLIKKFNS